MPDVQEKIIQALHLGNHRKHAAAYAGIDEATLRRWIARGRDSDDEPYTSFRKAVEQAEAKAQVMAMGCITKAARDGDWRAGAWILERRAPEHYAPRSRLFDPYRTLELLEEAGLVTDRDRALTALAQEGGAIDAGSVEEEDDLDCLDITEEQREILFGVLHAAKTQARVVDTKPIDEP